MTSERLKKELGAWERIGFWVVILSIAVGIIGAIAYGARIIDALLFEVLTAPMKVVIIVGLIFLVKSKLKNN